VSGLSSLNKLRAAAWAFPVLFNTKIAIIECRSEGKAKRIYPDARVTNRLNLFIYKLLLLSIPWLASVNAHANCKLKITINANKNK